MALLLWLFLLVATPTDGQLDTLPSNCLGVLGSLHCDNATNETCYTASYAVQRDNSVVFLISARTPASTWVGLGVSDDQRMTNTDVVLGAADGTNSFINDRFAFSQSEPPIDPSQDIRNASAERVDGVTTITFNRLRNSSDINDTSLDPCRFFLFAYGGIASYFSVPPIAMYHGSSLRGASAERICIPTFPECSSGLLGRVLQYGDEDGTGETSGCSCSCPLTGDLNKLRLHIYRIIDFERTTYFMVEGLQVEVCIVLNIALSREVIVSLSSFNMDSVAPGDYTAIAEDLTFSASETRICRNVISAEDDILEDDEGFLLTLATSDVTVILRRSEATVTILNDDTVTIGFEQSQYTATERNDVSVEVCASVLNGTLQREAVVTLLTTDGTATSVDPVDYIAVSMDLIFSAGNTRSCLDIPIKDDNILEGTENLFARLNTSDLDLNLESDEIEILILEDPNERVTVGFQPVTYSVEEGLTVEVCAHTISGTLEINAIATLSSSNGDAEAPLDFLEVSEDLTFTPTEPRQCRNVSTEQDGDSENDEVFQFRLSTIQSGVNLEPDTATVVILDDDSLMIGFEQTTYSVEEGLQVEVCVIVINSTLSRETVVTLSSSDNDAEAPGDYAAIAEDLTFSASETRICRNVISAEDDILEDDEGLLLTLATSDVTVILRRSEATVTILNDDTVTIGFEQSQYTATERNNVSVEVCASVLDGTLQREAVVTLLTTDGTATSVDPVDYIAVSMDLIFSAGDTRSCLDIPIKDDNILEGTENLFARLNTSDLDLNLESDEIEILILEDPNESITVGFQPVTYSVEEGLTVEVCAHTISGTLEINAIATLSSSNGDAEAPLDFLEVSEDLTFTPTEPRQCRNVSTEQDGASENDEVFQFRLSTIQSGVNLEPDTATVVILDDDSLMIGFEQTTYSVEEGLQVEVCVIVINSTLSRETVVTLSSSDNVAEAPGDYAAIAEDLTFSASETRICRNVISAEDDILEDDEGLLLTLATSDDIVILRRSEATVTILNDDTVTIGFEQSQYSATERNDVSVEVCASVLDGTLAKDTIITFFTTDGSATSIVPADYTAVRMKMTFSVGHLGNCHDIPIKDDYILEGTENLFASLTTLDSNVILEHDVTEIIILEHQSPAAISSSMPSAIIIGATAGGTSILLILIGITVLLRMVVCNKTKNNARSVESAVLAAPPKRIAFHNPTYEGAAKIKLEEIVDGRDRTKQFYSANIDKWRQLFAGKVLESSRVEYQQPIGEGAFGKVCKGRMVTLSPVILSVTYTEVAIKTPSNVTSDQEVEDFIAESAIMLDFHHPNVLSLVGVIFDTTGHLPVIVLPFMAHGDLRSYLRSKRTLTTSSLTGIDTLPTGLTEKILVEMCLDIAKGMQYLTTRKFVHRDLAARNCMVDIAQSVKIAGFGMSRDVYHSEYYRLMHKARLPVKWMPPESIFNNIFNEKTDVWSFGVTCWEVFSLGGNPFPAIDNADIPDFISSGHRLKKPILCSSEMCNIMMETWSDAPEDRPTFKKLVASLVSLVQSAGGLNHHYHSLDAPTFAVEERNTAPDAPYHVPEGPTVPASGSTGNEHPYAVLEGQLSNSTYSVIDAVVNSSASNPKEYEIPSRLMSTDSSHGSTS